MCNEGAKATYAKAAAKNLLGGTKGAKAAVARALRTPRRTISPEPKPSRLGGTIVTKKGNTFTARQVRAFGISRAMGGGGAAPKKKKRRTR